MKNLHVYAAPVAAAMLAAGCATQEPYYSPSSSYPTQTYPSQTYPSQQTYPTYPAYPSQPRYYNMGYVERIEVVKKGDSNNIAGTVIGGIVGGLIGSQIGSGRGNTAATIAGAAGGAIAGHTIQGRQRAATETFRVTVRMDNGSYQTVTQDNITDLRQGDRVRVEGDSIYRV